MTDIDIYGRFLFGLIFVLALIGILAWGAKRFGMIPGVMRMTPGRDKRLSVVEVLAVDAKHRLMLLRRDDIEHLIMLSANGETLIEQRIIKPTNMVKADQSSETEERS